MKTKCKYSGTLFIISRKYFSVFRGPHLPLDTPFWIDVPPCNAISEGRLPLCSTSSDAGALPSEVRIENDSADNFLSQFFFKNFLETTFIHVLHGTLFIISRTYPSIHHFGLEAFSCNAISEGRLSLCNTSSEAGALPSDKQYMIDLL